MEEYDKFGLNRQQLFGGGLAPANAAAMTRSSSGEQAFGFETHPGMLYANSTPCEYLTVNLHVICSTCTASNIELPKSGIVKRLARSNILTLTTFPASNIIDDVIMHVYSLTLPDNAL